VTRAETPEFRIHSWQDKVAWAFLNPTDPAASAIMLQEGEYVAQRTALNDTYEQVLATVSALGTDSRHLIRPWFRRRGSSLCHGRARRDTSRS